jgi:hypothetical protein
MPSNIRPPFPPTTAHRRLVVRLYFRLRLRRNACTMSGTGPAVVSARRCSESSLRIYDVDLWLDDARRDSEVRLSSSMALSIRTLAGERGPTSHMSVYLFRHRCRPLVVSLLPFSRRIIIRVDTGDIVCAWDARQCGRVSGRNRVMPLLRRFGDEPPQARQYIDPAAPRRSTTASSPLVHFMCPSSIVHMARVRWMLSGAGRRVGPLKSGEIRRAVGRAPGRVAVGRRGREADLRLSTVSGDRRRRDHFPEEQTLSAVCELFPIKLDLRSVMC